MSNNSPQARWSKEFVDHLRLVHFALMAVCFGLILLLESSKPYNPAVAVRQIQEIIQLQKVWGPDWLLGKLQPKSSNVAAFSNSRDAEAARYPVYIGGFEGIRITNSSGQEFVGTIKRGKQTDEPDTYVFVFPKDSLFVPQWLSASPSWTRGDPFSTGGVPQTLSDFRLWWSTLKNPTTVDVPVAVCPVGGIIGDGTTINPKSRKNAGSYVVLFENRAVLSAPLPKVELLVGKPSDSNQYGYVGTLPNQQKSQVFFAFSDIPQFVVDQESVRVAFPNWHPGEFSETFRDLDRAANSLGALDMQDAKKIIADDAPKGVEVFEALGVKFPSSLVTGWGPAVVVGIQFYLFLYLRQLSSAPAADDSVRSIPWIGMNPSRLARVPFFISLVLLPSSAVIFVEGRALLQMTTEYADAGRHADKGFFAIAATFIAWLIANVVLGIASWKLRPTVPKQTA